MPFDRAKFLELSRRGSIPEGDDLVELDEDTKPYSSLARDGAPEPDLSPDQGGDKQSEDEYGSDPAMMQLDKEQAEINRLRDAQRGAAKFDILGAASQQLAAGAGRPVGNEAMLKASQKQDQDLLHSQQAGMESRARVIAAIEARKQREAMERDRADARDLVNRDRQTEMKLRREALEQDRAFKRQERQEKLSNELRTPFGLANTADDAKKLKEAHEAKSNFDAKIQEMIDLRKKHGGGTLFNREDVVRGKQLSKDLLLEYKNMAKLGVLSKADEDIINAIIPANPLAFAMVPGQDPILSNLEKFKADSDRDFQTRVETRVNPSGRNQKPAAPKPKVDPALEAKIDAFMKKNGIADKQEAIRILKEHGKI